MIYTHTHTHARARTHDFYAIILLIKILIYKNNFRLFFSFVIWTYSECNFACMMILDKKESTNK